MTITPKSQNPKNKKQNFEKTFWFSLKRCFFGFPCFFLFFWFWNAKTKKTLCFSLVWENHQIWVLKPKNKKTQGTPKKTIFWGQTKKSLQRFVFLFFIGMFFGYIFVFLFGFLYYCTFLMWCCAESIVDAFCVWVVFLVFMVNPLS